MDMTDADYKPADEPWSAEAEDEAWEIMQKCHEYAAARAMGGTA